MKKHMDFWVQFKIVWSLFFTGGIILYTLINTFLNESSMKFIVVWQLALITMVLTAIHYIIFGEFMLVSLSNKYKIAIHFILCYLTIFISSVIIQWVDMSKLYSIGTFTLGYILFYLSLCWSMHIYYKATGEQLNKKLALYKQNKNIN
jgi:hypothetical protein